MGTRAGIVGGIVDSVPPIVKPAKRRSSVRKLSERRFVAWDGEGSHTTLKAHDLAGLNVNDFKAEDNTYFLFGCSTGDEVAAPRLTTHDCLWLITKVGANNPDVIHMAFAFNYDVTMITRDMPDHAKLKLKKQGYCYYGDWRLEWMKTKWFRVTHRPTKVSVQIYDVFTFFACSAVMAWHQYFTNTPECPAIEDKNKTCECPDPRLAKVMFGKNSRENLSYDDLEFAREYMRLELTMYAELAEKLRHLLGELDLHPSQWYGPGAVSRTAMTHHGVKQCLVKNLDERIIVAAQYAYFGGHFEQYRAGLYEGPVYNVDIRSAYPHALRLLPNLAKGMWHWKEMGYEVEPEDLKDFAIYRIRYHKVSDNKFESVVSPSAFPYRMRNHTVHYPNNVEGWYWGCEVKAALNFPTGTVEVMEGWEFWPETDERPFQFVEELYYQRAKWKKEGNPVQLAAKLVINSIYGKLAQRIGGKGKPPSFHQLEYAGFTTAYCRSMIYSAIQQDPSQIIAVETDGLYTTAPLELPYSSNLGDWDCEEYSGILYVQNGVYWTRKGDQWTKARIRGFGTGDLIVEDALEGLESLHDLKAHTKRFASLSGFVGRPELAYFVERDVEVRWGGNGKRVHREKLCPKCQGAPEQMHHCVISFPEGGISYKHTLPWRDNDKNVFQLTDQEINSLRLQTHDLLAQAHTTSEERSNAVYEMHASPYNHRN